ncbi:hypothetical protein BVRB_4g096230 [Beta vulgaris subsp. vulgaris]|uniref:RNA 3'-terminal phosphate cyclase insert domain-containing protein n=1 Tax=Beta vulgaris subsp. vulgaris TaxID=3555 RepID=A0A0J8BDM5_BETVV|nr:hypothetical protein BVRB_4g096230 [Beta vulgaris subsp. vulgaris]
MPGTSFDWSPGFGVSLVAETTYGCYISVDTAVSYPRREDTTESEDEKLDLKASEDVGVEIASTLLAEIEQGE